MSNFSDVPWAQPGATESAAAEQVVTPQMRLEMALFDLEMSAQQVIEAINEIKGDL